MHIETKAKLWFVLYGLTTVTVCGWIVARAISR